MQEIRETSRRATPFPKPQSVAFDGSSLWIGSVATSKIYRLNPDTLTVGFEAAAPGKPWGMAAMNGELRVICGETEEDNRFVRRFVPGSGFTRSGDFQCPDDTGSQLSFDGSRLYVSQWYKKRLLAVDDKGNVEDTIDIPHGVCGQTFANGAFYVLTTDDEAAGDYWITRVQRNGSYKVEDIAHVSFPARALAYDGKHFWTNHREADQIVSFLLPE
jgi:hypothetical protein